MKVAPGRQITNECCFPGCKERVSYFWDGNTRLYCDAHGGTEAIPLTAEERKRKHNDSGGKAYERAQKQRFRLLRKTLLTVGVEIIMSDYVIEKLKPLIEDLRGKREEVEEQLKPLQKEFADLDYAIKETEKTLQKMGNSKPPNVTPISSAKKRTGDQKTLREVTLDLLKQHPEGLTSGEARSMTGRNGVPSELSKMKNDGLIWLDGGIGGKYRLRTTEEEATNV
jgi:hypothetical protein